MQQQATSLRQIPWGRAIGALTAAYALIIAVILFSVYDDGWRIGGIVFGEVLFAAPMMIAYGLSKLRNSDGARQVLLGYEIGYSLLTLIVFWTTFTGEHDAQYQLTLFLIPLIGFPSVAIAGLVAARLR